jgi:type II secretory pathway component PulF
MTFTYQAFDATGRQSAGTLEAASADEARQNLRADGLFVTSIEQKDDGPAAAAGSAGRKEKLPSAGKRLRLLSAFARQMHVLVSSGTPTVQALVAIERQAEDPHWGRVVSGIRTRVETGIPLSAALADKPAIFDAVCRSLVAAGESSGNMPAMLDRLATLTRKQLQLRRSITGALVYPSLLMSLGVVVVIVMLAFVLPRFSGLFENLDSPLPPSTKFLLFLSDVLRGYWWAVLGALAVVFVALRHWFLHGSGKQTINTLMIRAPKIGKLTRNLLTARLARMLGVLLESRVPLLDALQLTKNAAVSPSYVELLTRAEDAVSRGEPISAVLGQTDLINPAVQEALRNGEATGQLGGPLVQMAEFLDEENEIVIKALTSLLEPAILIVLGLVVGLMAMSMFLPLFDLVSAASGGGK